MKRTITGLVSVLCVFAAAAQNDSAEQYAIIKFDEQGYHGIIQYAKAKAEPVTVEGKKGPTERITLGDVLGRIEIMRSEGWKVDDFDVSMGGNPSPTFAYYTWFLSKPKP